MQSLDRHGFEEAAGDFDAAVRRTPEIDHFCSSSAWILAADAALMPPREPFVRRSEHGWIALARVPHAAGWTSLEPLETAWCLACPLAYDERPAGIAEDLALACTRDAPREVLFLSGIPVASSLEGALVRALMPLYRLDAFSVPVVRRFRADLTGGVDGFLSRRSASFRARLRQAERKATRFGIVFEPVGVEGDAGAAALHARMVALEARSWKGMEGSGLSVAEMGDFYARMLPRLAREGAVRAMAATHEGRDVAIIAGGVTATPDGVCFRGLQFSFDDAHRGLSLGNLAQLSLIRALSAEGVSLYDLGSEVEYKRRWGERCLETMTLVAIPHGLRFQA